MNRRGTRMDGCTRSSCCLSLACSMRMLLVDFWGREDCWLVKRMEFKLLVCFGRRKTERG
jgi:hypothetical protein